MSRVLVRGWGIVSPGGWGVESLRTTLKQNEPVTPQAITCPGSSHTLSARVVPPPHVRPPFLAHPRVRRTSPISQYSAAAALEALGTEADFTKPGAGRLGLVLCVMSGCVRYSRRFYDETLKDPATASPLVFPETVFNAPASHLAALLGIQTLSYTLIGDQGTYLQGLAVAADWLQSRRVERCLVVGAEEVDWLVAESLYLFAPGASVSEGAGALCLGRGEPGEPGVELSLITSPYPFADLKSRALAARSVRSELNGQNGQHLLCDGLQGVQQLDREEAAAWSDWPGPRLSPKRLLGEAFTAAAAWQCVAAVDALATHNYAGADVSVVGSNQQAIAARFVKAEPCRP